MPASSIRNSIYARTGKNNRFIPILAALALSSASPVFFYDPALAQPRESAAEKKNGRAKQRTATTADREKTADNNNDTTREVVITATGFEQTVKDAPAIISVISREQIEKGAFRDLTDAFHNIQGVAVTGSAGQEDIFIRGLPGAYTLILVDGKRQSTREARTNGSSGFEQSFIPPAAAIERIEIVRGPMSSLYGSDALGGVVNIITRKVAEKWTGSFTLDGTANQHARYGNTLQGSYYIAGPLVRNVAGLQLWGRGLGRQEDSIRSGTPQKKEIDVTGRLTFTPDENNDIVFEGGHTRLRRYSTVGNVIEKSVNNKRPAVNTYNVNDRDPWSISYTGRFDWTTAEFSALQEIAWRTNYNWSPAESGYIANLRAPGIRNTVYDGKLTTPFELLGSHTLVSGGQYIQSRLTDQNPGLRTSLDERFTLDQWALFGEDEWWLADALSLTGGLRMDHHEIYGSHWSPRGYVVWHANDNLTFKGGVSTGFRAPEIRDIAPGYALHHRRGQLFLRAQPADGAKPLQRYCQRQQS